VTNERKHEAARRPSSDPIKAAFDAVNRLTADQPTKAKTAPKKRRPTRKSK